MIDSRKFRKIYHVDPILLAATLALLVLGTVMVYSASSLLGAERHGSSLYYLKRHLIALCVGLGAMSISFFVNVRALRHLAFPLFVASGVLLLLTAATSVGVAANHATRWFNLFGFSFQPAEIAKLTLVLYVASYLTKKGDDIKGFRGGLLPLLLTLGTFLVLILNQPDFGTTVVLAFTAGIMLFVGRAKLWHIGGLCMLALLSGSALIAQSAYRRNRILAFLNPWDDPQGKGFQIIQSFVAFRHGGATGQGLGDGMQKLLYLPEAHTDFIYSVVAEELGLLGSLAVIFLFALIVFRGFKLALRLQDSFAFQVAVGLTCLIGVQAFLNMAVVMGLVPTKGLTLPLISYGGTSLVITLASIGLLLSLSSSVSIATGMARRKNPR